MTKLHTPPGFTSILRVVVVKPRGPHHCTTCSGSVQASNTSSRGASIRRVMTISRSVGILASAVMASMPLPFLLLRLNLAEINLQAVETFVPQRPVALQPRVHVLQRFGRDAAGPPLRLAAPGDEPGA